VGIPHFSGIFSEEIVGSISRSYIISYTHGLSFPHLYEFPIKYITESFPEKLFTNISQFLCLMVKVYPDRNRVP
jgi:hypothetical protein